MKEYDEKAEGILQHWTEQEFRAAVGASPSRPTQDYNQYNPRGPHRWFAEAVGEVAFVIAMRQMSETWKSRPPYPSWQSCASGIRQHADDLTSTARLPQGMTLAQWYRQNEPQLQQDPTQQARNRGVAALLPLFEQEPGCLDAFNWLDDDTRGTFAEHLQDWHAHVPEQHRSFVRRIAQKFGIEIEDRAGR